MAAPVGLTKEQVVDAAVAVLDEVGRLDAVALREVAARLGVSISGLARAGVSDALTTDDIDAIRAENPDWLEHERGIQADVRAEAARLKDEKKPKN